MQRTALVLITTLALVSIITLLTAAFSFPGFASPEGGVLQEATQTNTTGETQTSTASLTVTETLQTSHTQSATASGTSATNTAQTLTPSQTPSATLFITATDTFAASSPTASETPFYPTEVVINTITVIPLPSFTYIFPHKTDTPVLLHAQRDPLTGALNKGGQPRLFARLFRLWPLAVLVIVWLFLAVWFVIAQRQMD